MKHSTVHLLIQCVRIVATGVALALAAFFATLASPFDTKSVEFAILAAMALNSALLVGFVWALPAARLAYARAKHSDVRISDDEDDEFFGSLESLYPDPTGPMRTAGPYAGLVAQIGNNAPEPSHPRTLEMLADQLEEALYQAEWQTNALDRERQERSEAFNAVPFFELIAMYAFTNDVFGGSDGRGSRVEAWLNTQSLARGYDTWQDALAGRKSPGVSGESVLEGSEESMEFFNPAALEGIEEAPVSTAEWLTEGGAQWSQEEREQMQRLASTPGVVRNMGLDGGTAGSGPAEDYGLIAIDDGEEPLFLVQARERIEALQAQVKVGEPVARSVREHLLAELQAIHALLSPTPPAE